VTHSNARAAHSPTPSFSPLLVPVWARVLKRVARTATSSPFYV
jgi:hypothetical protein